ncbi:MAG TPA: acyl-CoA oxidase [Bacteroidetes bacterium]|nr:acyl-CoA oxidase [Bacteroidota bacterium]
MPATNLQNIDYSPGLLSVLPLFYVGWSDSVLSPTEMKFIHQKLEAMPFLTKKEKELLRQWSDPGNPPGEEVFKEWVAVLKNNAAKIGADKKQSLIALGMEMAAVGDSGKTDGLWQMPETEKALAELESALGIKGQVSSNLLLSKLQIKSPAASCAACSFDAAELRDFLDADYKKTKNRMRTLMCDPLFSYQPNPGKEAKRLRVLQQVKALAKQGVSAYSFPKKYGGGERKGDHIAVFEMLAFGDLSLTIKFGVQFGLFGGALHMLGTEGHHKKYLEAMHRGQLLGCFAMTETGHGSNVKGLHTTAVYDKKTDEIIVHSPGFAAGKEFIGNALHCSMAAVFAQLIVDDTNHGVHAVLVKIRDEKGELLPGITVKDNGYKMGLNGVDNGRIWFDQVRVPRENLLDKYGGINKKGEYSSPLKNPSKRFFTMLGALVVGRISVGLAGISASKSALTIAIKYALKRKQFAPKDGEPETLVMDYPTHQHRLIPLLAKTYAYYFSLRKLADKYTHNTDGNLRHIETLAAGLKSKATWHATRTIQECREACGGKGYLSENRFADLKADSDIFTTFEGDNTVLMQLVAKGLLSEFKQSFHDEGYRAVLRYLYTRFSNTVDELNPMQTRNTSVEHLLDREFHKDAFHYRFQKLLLSLSSRMRDYLKKRIGPYQAFLKCQVHMVALADAYIDNIVLKSFIAAIAKCGSEPVKNILEKVCDLYALTVIQEEKGWFLENDYLSGSKSKAIRRVHNKLVQELRPEVEGLVDGFGIPGVVLGAEIVSGR